MKFEFDFIFEFIKKRKKEIIVVFAYLLLFSTLTMSFNKLKLERTNKEFDVGIAKVQYDNVKNSNLTENDLRQEIDKLISELQAITQRTPENLKEIDIYEMLSEIAQNTGNIYNLGNCEIKELKRPDSYKSYKVDIKSVNGSYEQFKNLLRYIDEYRVKVNVSDMDITRDVSNIQGRITLTFFGTNESEDNL